MGTYFSAKPVVQEYSVIINGYDTKNCLKGCLEKVTYEGRIFDTENALRDSKLFQNLVAFKSALSKSRRLHPLLSIDDVANYIIRLLLEYTIQERLEKSQVLWKMNYCPFNDYFELKLPYDYKHLALAPTQMIKNRGKHYFVSSYFWFDDVYDCSTCECPLSVTRRCYIQESRTQRRHQREWREYYTKEQEDGYCSCRCKGCNQPHRELPEHLRLFLLDK